MKLRKFISMGGRASSSELRSRIVSAFSPEGPTPSLAFRLIVTALFVAGAFAISGCSSSFEPKLSGGEPGGPGGTVGSFKGHIQGGQAPIYDADVYIFQTGESGYPGPGVAGNVSIISSSGTGAFTGAVNGNNYGAYVRTDANGNFLVSSFTCTPGAGVYIVSYGGQPIYGTPNSAAAEIAVFGVCPPITGAAGLAAANPFVNVTEVSTVAAAYALGGFTAVGYDFSHISTSQSNVTAMQNAFNMAQQLFSIGTTGGANTNSASLSGATFNAALMNTMANVLADCINSAGVTSSSSPCYILFQNATSTGFTGTGTIPSDTASAMINIVHYPASNVANIFALASNSYAPYTPVLTAQPSDLSNQVVYTYNTMYNPYYVEIDSLGNVYSLASQTAVGVNGATVTKISPTSGVVGATSISGASASAIDQSNNLFVLNQSSRLVYEYNPGTTTALGAQAANSPFNFSLPAGAYLDFLNSFIVGPTNNLEVTPDTVASVYNIPFTSGTYSTASVIATSPYVSGTQGIAVSGVGTTWVPSYNSRAVYAFKTTDGPTSPSYGISSGSYNPSAVALDAEANAYVADQSTDSLLFLNKNGSGYTPLVSYGSGYFMGQPVVDGLGAVMTPFQSGGACDFARYTGGSPLTVATAGFSGLFIRNCAAQSGNIANIAVDQGGNVWTPVFPSSGGYVAEVLGVAAPTIEPLSLQTLKLLPTNSSYDIRP